MDAYEVIAMHQVAAMRLSNEEHQLRATDPISAAVSRLVRKDDGFVMTSGSSCRYLPDWTRAERQRRLVREADIMAQGSVDVSDGETAWL